MEGNSIWRRKLLASLEFDPVLNFDDAVMYGLDLCLQVKERGLKLLYEPQALVYHHPAPRAPELDRQDRRPRLFGYCRNQTYIILKRFSFRRRLAYLAWWFLIGERGAWGEGSLLVDTLQGGWRKEKVRRASLAQNPRRASVDQKNHPEFSMTNALGHLRLSAIGAVPLISNPLMFLEARTRANNLRVRVTAACLNSRIPALRNQALVGVSLFVLGLWLAWEVGGKIVAEDTRSMLLTALVLAGCVGGHRFA